MKKKYNSCDKGYKNCRINHKLIFIIIGFLGISIMLSSAVLLMIYENIVFISGMIISFMIPIIFMILFPDHNTDMW